MKKLTLVFIGILTFTTAVQATSLCYRYVEEAEDRISPPYPNYFGAGEEYFHAAECYANQGQIEEAEKLYLKSAQHYEEASEYLVEDGDFRQSGLSHERAGIAYQEAGETEKAIQSYERSLDRYQTGGYSSEAAKIQSEIDLLERDTETDYTPKIFADARSIVGLFSLIALFISLIFLGIITVVNMPKRDSSPSSTPLEGRTTKSKPSTRTPKKTNQINQNQNQPEEKKKKEPKEKDPKKRAIKKLREKYKPKNMD